MAARRVDWPLWLQIVQVSLSIVILLCLVFEWYVHERAQNAADAERDRKDRYLIWEVNRHTHILTREGLAVPEDQLGLPFQIPTEEDPTP